MIHLQDVRLLWRVYLGNSAVELAAEQNVWRLLAKQGYFSMSHKYAYVTLVKKIVRIIMKH